MGKPGLTAKYIPMIVIILLKLVYMSKYLGYHNMQRYYYFPNGKLINLGVPKL